MSDTIQNHIYELLQVALGNRSRLTRPLSADEWEALFALCVRHAIVAVTLPALSALPAEQRPSLPLAFRWTAQADYTRQQSQKVTERCALATRKLEGIGFDTVVLKGQGLSLLYPNAIDRQSGDIDVWVRPRDLRQASLSARREATVQRLRPYMDPKRSLIDVMYHHMEFPGIEDTMVEVHFTPTWMFNPICNRRVQQFYDESMQSRVVDTGLGFKMPNAEMNVVFVLMHLYRHMNCEGGNLRQLMDYYYVLRAYALENRDLHTVDMPALLRRVGMYRFACGVQWVLQQVMAMPDQWLLCEPDEQAGRFLLSDVMQQEEVHYQTRWGSFWAHQCRSFRYASQYPGEFLFSFPFRVCSYVWRKAHGYADKY